jgi:transketolase
MGKDDKVVLLIGDIGGWGLRTAFSKFPNRCFNLGAAEQSMVSIGAGMAKEGFYPIIHSISSFLLRRAYEQIYLDFGVQGLKGLFVGIGEYPKLGPSHICNEDTQLVENIPHMDHYAPTLPATLDALMRDITRNRALAYIRL